MCGAGVAGAHISKPPSLSPSDHGTAEKLAEISVIHPRIDEYNQV